MNDKRPFFSIATPCFNSEKTIERTIKSVLAQEFKDYEYIIVDGGSTDGTLDIIKKYEPLFEGRMHWKSEPDKGLYDAFNKGIERSKGIYCWNVNSDDFIEPLALFKVYEFLKDYKQSEYPCVIGCMNFVSRDGSQTKIVYKSNSQKGIERAYKKDVMGLNHPATLVPRSVYAYVGLFDIRFRISADIDWFNRAFCAGIQFVSIDEVLTNMADGGASNGALDAKIAAKDRLLAFKKKYCYSSVAYWHLWKWWLRIYVNRIRKALV